MGGAGSSFDSGGVGGGGISGAGSGSGRRRSLRKSLSVNGLLTTKSGKAKVFRPRKMWGKVFTASPSKAQAAMAEEEEEEEERVEGAEEDDEELTLEEGEEIVIEEDEGEDEEGDEEENDEVEEGEVAEGEDKQNYDEDAIGKEPSSRQSNQRRIAVVGTMPSSTSAAASAFGMTAAAAVDNGGLEHELSVAEREELAASVQALQKELSALSETDVWLQVAFVVCLSVMFRCLFVLLGHPTPPSD